MVLVAANVVVGPSVVEVTIVVVGFIVVDVATVVVGSSLVV